MPIRPSRRPARTASLRLPLAVFAGLLALTGTWAQTIPPTPTPTGKPVFEEWAVLMLDGKQCGFASTITTSVDTPTGTQYHTELQQEFVVKRMGASMRINELSHIVEDAEGGVLSFTQISSGMGSDIETRGVREGDELVVSSRGETQRYKIPRLAALGPEAVRRLENAVPLKTGQKFSINAFTTDYPQAVVTENGTVLGRELHDVRGVKRELWKITSEMPVMGDIKAIIWTDDQNNEIETDITMPGLGEMSQYVTDRAECMKQPEGAEIFATSLIEPQQALPDLSKQAQAVYRLTTDDISKKLTLWNEDEQRVLKSEPGLSEIEVTVPSFTAQDATWKLPYADTPDLHPYLEASTYLESDSPEIRVLAQEAVGSETNPVLAAHKIEQFVRGYITKKDLNIGFASAEETAKSREGDCTEHAVLCAAIGRAAGLPTRCVFGLGYIPPGDMEPTISNAVDTKTGIFGFHMWAEAWIGPDRWMPMDAALDGFDIGHIAINIKSALADINPMVDLNMPILQLMQNLKITVLKTVSKQDDATPAAKAAMPPWRRLSAPHESVHSRPSAGLQDLPDLSKRGRFLRRAQGPRPSALQGNRGGEEAVSFDVNEGELVGFLGPNGAGKTTVLKMLSGLLYPTSGEATVLGYTPWAAAETISSASLRARKALGQKINLWWDLPAAESLELNRVIYGLDRAAAQRTIDELTELLDVRDKLDTMVRELSLGERMKMELIAALLHRPRVLFPRRADHRARRALPEKSAGVPPRLHRAPRHHHTSHVALHAGHRGTLRAGRHHRPRPGLLRRRVAGHHRSPPRHAQALHHADAPQGAGGNRLHALRPGGGTIADPDSPENSARPDRCRQPGPHCRAGSRRLHRGGRADRGHYPRGLFHASGRSAEPRFFVVVRRTYSPLRGNISRTIFWSVAVVTWHRSPALWTLAANFFSRSSSFNSLESMKE